MRQKYVAANWKMFTNSKTACQLAEAVVSGLAGDTRVRVALCPPFPYLAQVGAVLRGSAVGLGAQNLYPEMEGAFTGEVSPAMLLDVGCRLVIVGHSERRHKLGERDDFINRKVHAALDAGLEVIFCVGETLADREEGSTENVLARQLDGGLVGLDAQKLARVTLAYEPVWAIGTGYNATPAQARAAHGFLRQHVASQFGPALADSLIIQYGGSVKPENARSLFHEPDVDGGLIGGASLKSDQFLAIVGAALTA